MLKTTIVASAALLLVSTAHANVFITEFCSDTGDNQKFEFAEFTNLGNTPVDMTGWSEDDSTAKPNKTGHSLTGLGILAPGESGIITEATPAAFRSYWGLASTVPVVGPYTNDSLSTTADSVTLFNASGTLVDRIDYSGAGTTGDSVTRNAPLDALGLNDNALWVNSQLGDSFGSFRAAQNVSLVGNPGEYNVPEPTSLTLLSATGLLAIRRRARR
jgi:predicted extracellular nuclease